MVYIARLMAITKVSAVTANIMPFVQFQAGQKDIELKDDDKVAILQIENIPSYHIIFLETDITMDGVVKELADQDSKLNEESRAVLEKHFSEK
jgi:hypothetical protein